MTEVGKRWSALYADACDIMTTRTIRQDAWEELTAVHCLHPSCPRKRSVMEVKKQWQNLIVRSKQERLQADEWRAGELIAFCIFVRGRVVVERVSPRAVVVPAELSLGFLACFLRVFFVGCEGPCATLWFCNFSINRAHRSFLINVTS